MGLEQIITRIRHSTSSIAELDPATRDLAVRAYSQALHAVFWLQVGLSVLALVACMGMREVHLPDKGPAPSGGRKVGDETGRDDDEDST